MGGDADETVPAGRALESSPFRGDLDSELAARPPRRLPTLTLVLGAGVMLVAGVIVGIQAQKAMGGPSGVPATATRQGDMGPGGFGGFGGGQGRQGGQEAGQDGGGRGGMTVGTVQRVEDGKVYVQTADGSVVTVNTTDETSVRVTKEGKVTDLEPGGAVVVRGAAADDGSVTATVITEPSSGAGRR
ncbi:hypothetical protein [Streptosporangium sp. H16]|uniref:hypothetical protein n=1 Tax=Streptosporangium sp. H16 TaxID=3444184 RepID=UPI003F79CCCD